MDIFYLLPKWEEMGNLLKDYYDNNDNYVIEFIDKLGNIVGHIITYPGFIRWQIPNELMPQLNNK